MHHRPLVWSLALSLGAAGTGALAGPNVSVSGDPARTQSESSIAIDRARPQRLIAACNQVNAPPQMLFSSADGGATWRRVEMALATVTFQSGPAVAWDAQGNGYASALGVTCLDPSCFDHQAAVQLARSADGGQSWSAPSALRTAPGEDQVRIAANHQSGASCASLVCAAWTDTSAGVRDIHATCSTGGSGTAADSVLASGPLLFAATPVFGPGGEVYVVWLDARPDDPGQSGFGFSRSDDCGNTWTPVVRFGPTRAALDLAIPAMCERRVLRYPAVDVDRSSGPRRGTIYVAWTDAAPGANCPDYRLPCNGCPASACALGCTTHVYVASSADSGQTWSAPAPVHSELPGTDQFNPALAVDDADGTLHVVWSDTRDDPARLASNLYHRISSDGGATWGPEERISGSASDETAVAGGADSNQHGDHGGLAVHACNTFPTWTDRRDGVEQIYTAATAAGCCVAGTPPADLENTVRAVKVSAGDPELSWNDLGGLEADYAVYRGDRPDPVADPPARLGTSGGPDVDRYTDSGSPASPGCSFYKVRGAGACGEELSTW